jgi:hypothetical protein
MAQTLLKQSIVAKHVHACVILGLMSSAVFSVSGCAPERRKASIPWHTAVLVRPVSLHFLPPENMEEAAPDLAPEIPIPAPLALGRSGPARPRIPSASINSNAHPAQPDIPQIVPGLSAQESASLQKEEEQSLNTAERNLAATSGKSLNATQADLASKVRSFITDARDAGRAGDWERARDLAKKAQILSEELIGSL